MTVCRTRQYPVTDCSTTRFPQVMIKVSGVGRWCPSHRWVRGGAVPLLMMFFLIFDLKMVSVSFHTTAVQDIKKPKRNGKGLYGRGLIVQYMKMHAYQL